MHKLPPEIFLDIFSEVDRIVAVDIVAHRACHDEGDKEAKKRHDRGCIE